MAPDQTDAMYQLAAFCEDLAAARREFVLRTKTMPTRLKINSARAHALERACQTVFAQSLGWLAQLEVVPAPVERLTLS